MNSCYQFRDLELDYQDVCRNIKFKLLNCSDNSKQQSKHCGTDARVDVGQTCGDHHHLTTDPHNGLAHVRP